VAVRGSSTRHYSWLSWQSGPSWRLAGAGCKATNGLRDLLFIGEMLARQGVGPELLPEIAATRALCRARRRPPPLGSTVRNLQPLRQALDPLEGSGTGVGRAVDRRARGAGGVAVGGLTYDPRAWNVLLGSLFAFSRASRTEQCFRARPAFFAVAASGTLVLVTNRHVVTGRHQANGQPLHTSGALPEELLIHHHSQPVGGWTTLVAPLIGADGLPAWREHPTLGAAADFVVLPAACPVGVSIFGYDVASNADIRIGTTSIVSVIGFPFGVSGSGTNPGFPVWATGFVASGPTEDYNSLPVFLIDCRSRPGQSGSPVIAYRHGGAAATTRGDVVLETGTSWHFLGVYSGRIDPRSDIGMVWKLSSLRELLAVM
jgi:hypothetical protein